MKNLLEKVIQNYGKEFNNLLYEQFQDSLKFWIFTDKEKINNAYIKIESILPENKKNKTIDINILKKEFDNIKYCKQKVVIKEEFTIIKYLNPKDEFYFPMMIH